MADGEPSSKKSVAHRSSLRCREITHQSTHWKQIRRDAVSRKQLSRGQRQLLHREGNLLTRDEAGALRRITANIAKPPELRRCRYILDESDTRGRSMIKSQCKKCRRELAVGVIACLTCIGAAGTGLVDGSDRCAASFATFYCSPSIFSPLDPDAGGREPAPGPRPILNKPAASTSMVPSLGATIATVAN